MLHARTSLLEALKKVHIQSPNFYYHLFAQYKKWPSPSSIQRVLANPNPVCAGSIIIFIPNQVSIWRFRRWNHRVMSFSHWRQNYKISWNKWWCWEASQTYTIEIIYIDQLWKTKWRYLGGWVHWRTTHTCMHHHKTDLSHFRSLHLQCWIAPETSVLIPLDVLLHLGMAHLHTFLHHHQYTQLHVIHHLHHDALGLDASGSENVRTDPVLST